MAFFLLCKSAIFGLLCGDSKDGKQKIASNTWSMFFSPWLWRETCVVITCTCHNSVVCLELRASTIPYCSTISIIFISRFQNKESIIISIKDSQSSQGKGYK